MATASVSGSRRPPRRRGRARGVEQRGLGPPCARRPSWVLALPAGRCRLRSPGPRRSRRPPGQLRAVLTRSVSGSLSPRLVRPEVPRDSPTRGGGAPDGGGHSDGRFRGVRSFWPQGSPSVSLCVCGSAGLTAAAPAAWWFSMCKPLEARAAAGALVAGTEPGWGRILTYPVRPGPVSLVRKRTARARRVTGLRGAREVGRAPARREAEPQGKGVGEQRRAEAGGGEASYCSPLSRGPARGPRPAAAGFLAPGVSRPLCAGALGRAVGLHRAGPGQGPPHCVRDPRHRRRNPTGPGVERLRVCQWGSCTPQAFIII